MHENSKNSLFTKGLRSGRPVGRSVGRPLSSIMAPNCPVLCRFSRLSRSRICRQSVTQRTTGLIRHQEHARNTVLGHILSRSRRWLLPIAPEEAACPCVGAAVILKMLFMFGILLMTVSCELAGVLGVAQVLRPDGNAPIGQSRHVLRVLVDRLRHGCRRSR